MQGCQQSQEAMRTRKEISDTAWKWYPPGIPRSIRGGALESTPLFEVFFHVFLE